MIVKLNGYFNKLISRHYLNKHHHYRRTIKLKLRKLERKQMERE